MSDLIEREQALSAFDTDDNKLIIRGSENAGSVRQYLKRVMYKIENLSPAQPERKKGFWYALQKGDKGYSAGDFKCSVCGEPNHTWLPKPNFCPNCGADMRGEQK